MVWLVSSSSEAKVEEICNSWNKNPSQEECQMWLKTFWNRSVLEAWKNMYQAYQLSVVFSRLFSTASC